MAPRKTPQVGKGPTPSHIDYGSKFRDQIESAEDWRQQHPLKDQLQTAFSYRNAPVPKLEDEGSEDDAPALPPDASNVDKVNHVLDGWTSVGGKPHIDQFDFNRIKRLDAGDIRVKDLYRSYKHTPHAPASVFLKYMVHRTNHLNDYENPEKGHLLDSGFMTLVQRGEAARKNGHLSMEDLHKWTKKNAHVANELIAHRDAMQRDILNDTGFNVRDINGEPHVAIARGLKSDIMTVEHPLASWADVPETGFGTRQFHAWVPVKDVWFSYHHFDPKMSSDDYGHENEVLASHTGTKYQASPEDVKESRLKLGSYDIPAKLGDRDKFVREHTRLLTDADLAAKSWPMNRDASNLAYHILSHYPNAGPLTYNSLVRQGIISETRPYDNGLLYLKAVPREVALKWIKTPRLSAQALKNPNLTNEDLINHINEDDTLSAIRDDNVDAMLHNPVANSQTAEALWARVRLNRGVWQSPHSLVESHLTPKHVLDEIIDGVIKRDFASPAVDHPSIIATSVARNPNITEEQTDKLINWSRANEMVTSNLLGTGNPSLKTVESLIGGKSSYPKRRYLHNPRASDDGMYMVAKHDLDTGNISALVEDLQDRETRRLPIPASVQHLLVDRLGLDTAEFSASTNALRKLAQFKSISPEVVGALATHPNEGVRDGLYRNKSVTPEHLEAAWPKSVPFHTPPQDRVLRDLWDTINSRKEYAERFDREHLIRPLPAGLAKSEDGKQEMWEGEIQHWLHQTKNADPAYLIVLPKDVAHQAMASNELQPDWTEELLEGQAVIAWKDKPHYRTPLQGSIAPGSVLFRFQADEKPQKVDVARVYWADPVKIKNGSVLSVGMEKAEPKKVDLLAALNLHPKKLESWEEDVAMLMLGHDPKTNKALAAARFLTGGKQEPDWERFSLALKVFDDVDRAALYAFQIPDSKKNLKALKNTMELAGESLGKAEEPLKGPEPHETIHSIEPATPDAKDVAHEVMRGVKAGLVHPLRLSGRHSKGALAVRDPETGYVFLMKPGSGKPSPAAGVREEKASQSAREAAAWHVADIMGIGQSIPRCELVIQNGEQEVAVMKLLGPDFKPLDEKNREKEQLASKVLQPYLRSGLLHKWAVFDLVTGNTDSHGQNLLVNPGGSVALIDHGSSFASEKYAPATDPKSFVPYYLRSWAPLDFMKLSPEKRLSYMPVLTGEQDKELKSWLADIEPLKIEAVLKEYGINPVPTMTRLQSLRDVQGNLSEAVCRFFAGVN